MAGIKEQLQNQTRSLLDAQANDIDASSSKFNSITNGMHEMNEDIHHKIYTMSSNIDSKMKDMTEKILSEINGLKEQN